LHLSSVEDLVAYSDADWVGCSDTHKSTLGYVVFLGDNLISLSLDTLFRSSAEVEYRVVANEVAKATWLCQLLLGLHTPLRRATGLLQQHQHCLYVH